MMPWAQREDTLGAGRFGRKEDTALSLDGEDIADKFIQTMACVENELR
jgi:hypothetical protein